ncbi:hypothetical protein HMPREF9123_1952 [Neisseria bacilliformis ATCC BAA-1200]|uniref:Uncharacterized protein n=1 Tax=Neisseria bacilliformis ATCC BAA-1200 TaxID=888742 RepID=F2BDZ6_9NEIS|nr:hypothetical protein HMPREF9123_1952 [Neisseria bacilliformis ATCC BAA-1200]
MVRSSAWAAGTGKGADYSGGRLKMRRGGRGRRVACMYAKGRLKTFFRRPLRFMRAFGTLRFTARLSVFCRRGISGFWRRRW